MVVALGGHTVRVTGLLPETFRGELPYYVVTEPAGTRTRVQIVYPIATGDTRLFTESGLPVRNPQPGSYSVCRGSMHTPTVSTGAYGGFPFIEYVCNHRDSDGRVRSGIALHGPITDAVYEGTPYWELQRGPVSHACNRMLGEHVLEVARLIGFERGRLGAAVKVVGGADTWRGRPVDVDYPARGFTRPAGAFVFPTWQAVVKRAGGVVTATFPRWACEASRCSTMPPNAGDPVSGGRALAPIGCPEGYAPIAAGAGVLCSDGVNAWGPFTQGMVNRCRAAGGGPACDTDRWAKDFALSIRGAGLCPAGARYDALTGYCAEGESAFGPFPAEVVATCEARGGGSACRSARWNRFFLASILGRL